MWVLDSGSFPKSSRRFSINTLNISFTTNVAQNKVTIHTNYLLLAWPTLNLLMKSSVGCKNLL